MLTTGIQNLPEPPARAQAAYHDGTARLAPVSPDRLARRVEHVGSSVQFVLDHPAAARHLHDLTGDLRTVPQLGILLPQVLQGAMASVGPGDGYGPARSRPRPGSRRVGPVRVVGHGPDDRELRPPGRPARAERSARLTGLRSRP